MENNVKVLKLITGEEVIARVTEEENNLITLTTPMILQILPAAGTGTRSSLGFALVPWMKAAKNEKVTLSVEYILVIDEASDQTEKNYLQVVTGLSL